MVSGPFAAIKNSGNICQVKCLERTYNRALDAILHVVLIRVAVDRAVSLERLTIEVLRYIECEQIHAFERNNLKYRIRIAMRHFARSGVVTKAQDIDPRSNLPYNTYQYHEHQS